MDIEEAARQVCVGEFSSFYVTYNNHKSSYQTAAQAIEENFNNWYDPEDFASPEEMERCKQTNTIWTVQWYPDTPVGCYVAHASTLGRALEAMISAGKEGA